MPNKLVVGGNIRLFCNDCGAGIRSNRPLVMSWTTDKETGCLELQVSHAGCWESVNRWNLFSDYQREKRKAQKTEECEEENIDVV